MFFQTQKKIKKILRICFSETENKINKNPAHGLLVICEFSNLCYGNVFSCCCTSFYAVVASCYTSVALFSVIVVLFRAIPRRVVTPVTAVLRTCDPGQVPGRARTYGGEQVGAWWSHNHSKCGVFCPWNGPIASRPIVWYFFYLELLTTDVRSGQNPVPFLYLCQRE